MHVLYLTDIHDSLKNLRTVIQKTNADLYIISGDLIYKAFYTEEKLYDFLVLQDFFYTYIAENNYNFLPSELADHIISQPDKFSKKLLTDAVEYKMLFKQAAVNMKEKYAVIKDLISKYAQADTVFIPGNYDMDLQYTALYDLDLHKKKSRISRYTIYRIRWSSNNNTWYT